MKFDLNREVTGLTGSKFPVSGEGRCLNLRDVIHYSLRAPVLYDSGNAAGTPRPLMPSDLDDREKIVDAMKGDTLDIKPELIGVLRKLIGASGLSPEVCVCVSVLLNAGE